MGIQRQAVERLQQLGLGGVDVRGIAGELLLLTFALRTLPLGTAYAVWTGIGALGTFVVGVVLMGESLGPWRVVSGLCILAGVVGLRLTQSR